MPVAAPINDLQSRVSRVVAWKLGLGRFLDSREACHQITDRASP